MFFDSHAHLQLIDYDRLGQSMDDVVLHAKQSGVSKFMCVATKFSQYDELLKIKNLYPNVSLSIGLHPNESPDQICSVEEIVALGKNKHIVAIGETGLDYYRTKPNETWQRERFISHIRAAKQLKKPLIIHTRDSMDDTLDILKSEEADTVSGIMHCFSGNLEQAKRAIELNFMISFSGIVTFKNARDLQEIAKALPLEHILIETDCPYLAPVPMRGKINQPAYVRHVGEFLAELKNIKLETFKEITFENAKRLNIVAN